MLLNQPLAVEESSMMKAQFHFEKKLDIPPLTLKILKPLLFQQKEHLRAAKALSLHARQQVVSQSPGYRALAFEKLAEHDWY